MIFNNQLQRQIYEKIVKPTISEIQLPTTGIIYNMNYKTNLADVMTNMPNSTDEKLLKNVPIQLGSKGLSQAGPFKGDRVVITYADGTIHSPYITSIIDLNYNYETRQQQQTHSRKGPLIPDYICNREDWPIEEGDLMPVQLRQKEQIIPIEQE